MALWDTIFLSAGLVLGGKEFMFFDTPMGGQKNGRTLHIADTNVREGSRLPGGASYRISSVTSLVKAQRGETPTEQLATAFGRDDSEEIEAHGVLHWDFLQTRVPVAPLWRKKVDQDLLVESSTTFGLLLQFGPDAPTLTLPHIIRVVIEGTAKNQLF
jgi:hypothetical protein